MDAGKMSPGESGEKKIICNKAALDWLSVGSFYAPDWMTLKMFVDDYAAGRGGDLQTARRMQYRGVRSGSVFLGTATQGHKVRGKTVQSEHALLQVSGAPADCLWQDVWTLTSGAARCTRLDVQVTVPLPGWYSARRLTDLLRCASVWSGRGRPPKVQMIDGDGLDTVYVGSRTSDRFVRIYVKEVSGVPWLRYEVQYNGQYARQVWAQLGTSEITVSDVMASELRRMPMSDALREHFENALDGAPGPGVRVERQETNTLAWLRGQVSDVVCRMMIDHDEGDEVRALVRYWAGLADAADRAP